jgi:hypothetical protein
MKAVELLHLRRFGQLGRELTFAVGLSRHLHFAFSWILASGLHFVFRPKVHGTSRI